MFEAGKPATVVCPFNNEPVDSVTVKRVMKAFVETSDGRQWYPNTGDPYPKSRQLRYVPQTERRRLVAGTSDDIARRAQANQAREWIEQTGCRGYGQECRALSDDAALDIRSRWERDIGERRQPKEPTP